MKVISVHMPKAGGSSIANSLETAFGPNFRRENQDDPANPSSERNLDPARYFSRSRVLPPEVECLHGHFHPGQFSLGEDVYLFTMLRHPVMNLISIYSYWQTLPPPINSLHDYFVATKLGIIGLARVPLLRWLYSRTFFGGFDMARFNMIGRHESRAEAVTNLGAAIGVKLDTSEHANVTPFSAEREALVTNQAVIRRLHTILADDIRFYEQHCA